MRLRSVFSLPALLAFAACAPKASNPFETAGPAATEIELLVDNRGFNDVRLWALSSRGPQSLGNFTGSSEKKIRIPWRQLDQISFRIDVLAGQSYRTDAVNASPGDHLELIIPNNPYNSILKVR